MIDPRLIPDHLRAARAKSNLSRVKVAEQLEVNERTISSWENGKTEIGLFQAIRLCDIYGVSLGELIGDTEHRLTVQALQDTSVELQRLRWAVEELGKHRDANS